MWLSCFRYLRRSVHLRALVSVSKLFKRVDDRGYQNRNSYKSDGPVPRALQCECRILGLIDHSNRPGHFYGIDDRFVAIIEFSADRLDLLCTDWARPIQKVYEVDPLECTHCGATLRIIALIDDSEVIERILRRLILWDPPNDNLSPAGPDPPFPKGETIPLTYHPVMASA